MAYIRTRAIALRCTDYSETSQVVALCTPDLGQVHGLARGARRPRKDGRMPFDLLTHYDVVLSRRKPGHLHLLTEWSVVESFPGLRHDLRCFWMACHAAEAVLSCTSENPDDGPVYQSLLTCLRCMGRGNKANISHFDFLIGMFRVMGCLPVTDRCVGCNGPLTGPTRFSSGAGGALCGDCGMSRPDAFPVSRGALAVIERLARKDRPSHSLRIMSSQVAEIRRAFNEQIQYYLGRPLRTSRFLTTEPGGRITGD